MNISYKQALENLKKAQAEVEQARQAELGQVIKEIKEKIAEYDLTAEDLGLKPGAKKSVAKRGEAKYANPENAAQVWSGKGRKPAWVMEYLAQGGNLCDLQIHK